MEHLFPLLGKWVWFVAAGILLLFELMTPGVFFIWLATAAAVLGILDLLVDLPWQAELLLFAVLSAVAVVAGRRV
ncbi:MAG: NfeD family protein, partial [Aestuariivirga sp.]|nr:NfeD family protein [Aestuariivirga sp.]